MAWFEQIFVLQWRFFRTIASPKYPGSVLSTTIFSNRTKFYDNAMSWNRFVTLQKPLTSQVVLLSLKRTKITLQKAEI
jgi:hypothetical protein